VKVSIITVCFNSVVTIRDTINSVLAQDFDDVQYLVIDGGSSDGTMDIVRSYGDNIDVVVSEPDQGIYDAMNKGIELATGDVVGLLNSDDIYAYDSVLSELVELMVSSGSDTVFADLTIVDADNFERVIRHYDSSKFNPGRLAYGWMPAHPTFMVKRELYVKHGGYLTDYQIAADFEMVARLLHTAAASYAYLPVVAVKMRAGGISTRGLKSSWIINREIVRACRANGIKTSLVQVLLKTPAKLMEYLGKHK
jgi:glycosyltransferase involved in cell wall biosynthesis